MLSVLIPTYNYNVQPLVANIQQQCKLANLAFEVLVLDDASKSFHQENEAINELEHCSYEILPQNIGRSAIRNLLAERACYDWLLFLDADVFPKSENFIETYLRAIQQDPKEVIYGGIVYQADKPANDQLLRWTYGNEREALAVEKRKVFEVVQKTV